MQRDWKWSCWYRVPVWNHQFAAKFLGLDGGICSVYSLNLIKEDLKDNILGSL